MLAFVSPVVIAASQDVVADEDYYKLVTFCATVDDCFDFEKSTTFDVIIESLTGNAKVCPCVASFSITPLPVCLPPII